jgi:hypothetical protein
LAAGLFVGPALGSRLKKQNCSIGKPRSFCWLGATLASPIGACVVVHFCAFYGEIRGVRPTGFVSAALGRGI